MSKSVLARRDPVVVPTPPGGAEPTRRHLSDKQAQTVDRLVVAAVEELRASGYNGLTVRNVARRAGVAPATAYNYFTSRDHLVAEVFWRRLTALPEPRFDGRIGAARRVSETMAELTLLVADEPELATACTVAVLASDPDVKVLRDRIGWEWHRRLEAALGDAADPVVLATLEFAVSGALLRAGMGHMGYDELPAEMARVVGLVVR